MHRSKTKWTYCVIVYKYEYMNISMELINTNTVIYVINLRDVGGVQTGVGNGKGRVERYTALFYEIFKKN